MRTYPPLRIMTGSDSSWTSAAEGSGTPAPPSFTEMAKNAAVLCRSGRSAASADDPSPHAGDPTPVQRENFLAAVESRIVKLEMDAAASSARERTLQSRLDGTLLELSEAKRRIAVLEREQRVQIEHSSATPASVGIRLSKLEFTVISSLQDRVHRDTLDKEIKLKEDERIVALEKKLEQAMLMIVSNCEGETERTDPDGRIGQKAFVSVGGYIGSFKGYTYREGHRSLGYYLDAEPDEAGDESDKGQVTLGNDPHDETRSEEENSRLASLEARLDGLEREIEDEIQLQKARTVVLEEKVEQIFPPKERTESFAAKVEGVQRTSSKLENQMIDLEEQLHRNMLGKATEVRWEIVNFESRVLDAYTIIKSQPFEVAGYNIYLALDVAPFEMYGGSQRTRDVGLSFVHAGLGNVPIEGSTITLVGISTNHDNPTRTYRPNDKIRTSMDGWEYGSHVTSLELMRKQFLHENGSVRVEAVVRVSHAVKCIFEKAGRCAILEKGS